MADEVSALVSAQEEARRRIKAIKPDQWDARTPCADWTVRDLVVHMAVGASMSVAVLAAQEWDRNTILSKVAESDDLPGDWETRAAAEIQAFAKPGALEGSVIHPMVGEIPARQFIGMRTTDALVHAWDISRSVGLDEALNEALVASVWNSLEPLAPVIGQLGVFGEGPSGEVDSGAPLQLRLLDLTGRRP